MKKISIGLLFASLWGSASVVTKIGLKVGQPLFISNTRFFLAGILMLCFGVLYKKNRLPKRSEWLPLTIYGALNVTIYLSAFVFSMKHLAAGIGTLGVATCPLIISVLNAFWLQKKVPTNTWIGLLISMIGVGVAVYPLLLDAKANLIGMVILGLSMFSYSIGTVYFQSRTWDMPRLSINGWQVLIGGVLLLPFTLITFEATENQFYNSTLWNTIIWLAIPVSIVAVQLWLYLLYVEPIRASLWLFLCPIFGFLYAAIFNDEPITAFTVIGTSMVIFGLYLGQK